MSPQESLPPAVGASGQPSWIAPLKPSVPDHELLVRIGGGSYGDVWLARSVVGTWRAVKVVFRDRFLDARPYEREFSGIQKFEPLSRSNEGFIDILQIGCNDTDGYFYYVMELADDAADAKKSDQCSVINNESVAPEPGQPLAAGHCVQAMGLDPETYVSKTLSKALLQRGRLPIGECLELGITLNLALARLHTAGLIHRDIKPSNIIFVGGVPKLADIGLVIEVAEARSYVGTEGFIPPEGPNSPQADLYSLGKVLYEAGMGKDRKDFPEPPTQIAQVPDSAELLEFNAILLKACAANVKERYQSAEEMNADLALLQSGGSVRRQRTLTRRLRSVQRAGVVVASVAVVISAGWFWQARQTRLLRDLANEKTRLAAEKTQLANENRERLIRLDVANGVRLLDGGDLSGSRIWFEEAGGKRAGRYLPGTDLSGSLLWFSEALPRVTQSIEAEIHRIRIQSVLACTPRLLQIVVHEGSLRAGTFSPDGRLAATGSRDGELRVWDVETAQPVFPPLQLGKAIRGLCFSRDGRRLIAHSTPDPGLPGHKEAAAFALILDASTGRPIFQQVIDVVKTACSSDGRWLAVARTNFSIEVFDASTGRTVVELRGHSNEVTGLAFSADGARILTFSEDRTARVWRIPSGESEGPPLRHEKAVERVAISPDGRRVATGTEPDPGEVAGQVRTWDAKTGALIGSPLKARGHVWTLFFDSAAGRRLFIGDEQLRLMVWDIDTQTEALPALKTRSYETSGRAFSPSDARLAVASQDNNAYVWSLSTGELLLPPLRHSTWVESVDFSPDGTKLLTTCDDGTARVWDLMTPAETEPALRMGAPITGAAMSEDGSRLLVALRDGSIRRINLRTLHEEPPPMPILDSTTPQPGAVDHSILQYTTALSLLEAGSPQALAFDKSARQWAAALEPYAGNGKSHSVGLWRQEGKQLRHLELVHPRAAVIVAFDPEGSRLVTVADDVSIRVWNTADGSLARDLSLPDRSPSCAAVASDARTAVVSLGRRDETARDLQLVDLDTAQRIGAPIHEEEGIGGVAFSPDGRRLVVVGGQLARIWDAVTGKPLTASFKPGGRLTSVGWSPDGGHVITAGLADMAKIWDGATGRPELSPMWSAEFRQAYFSQDGRFVEEWGEDRHVRLWDAATGEVLTPRWHLDGDLWIVRVTASGHFVVASGDTIRLRTLQPNPLPADVIGDYAQLLSGRHLNAAGVMEWIPPMQLIQLHRSLRAREPALFAELPSP